MSNYVNNVSIYGLMNRLAFINTDTNNLSFYKTKNRQKVVYFDLVENETDYKQINYMYMNDEPAGRKASCMEQIVSDIDISYFTNTKPVDKKHKEIKETVSKYSKLGFIIKEIQESDLPAILDMIERWRYADNGGMKYKWQEHAAIDKFCANKYVTDEEFRNKTIGTVFYNDKQECLGYSLIANYVDADNEVKYLTRKVYNQNGYRNLTEYIDWFTFKLVYEKLGKPNNMYINWGCSSGGVHWYKTHKWPVYSLEKKWFMTVKNGDK